MTNNVVFEQRYGFLVVRVRQVRSEGRRKFKVSIHRSYRNGELWHESTRFGADDIPFVRYLLDEAHTWMLERPEMQNAE